MPQKQSYLGNLEREKEVLSNTYAFIRQKMEEAPRHLCPNDLSDEAFIESLTRALWKRGAVIDRQGDFYEVRERGV